MKIDDKKKEEIFRIFYLRRICKSLENLQKVFQEVWELEKRELPLYDEFRRVRLRGEESSVK